MLRLRNEFSFLILALAYLGAATVLQGQTNNEAPDFKEVYD